MILVAPEVFVENDWVHAGEQHSAVIICRVLANPAPKVVSFLIFFFTNKTYHKINFVKVFS